MNTQRYLVRRRCDPRRRDRLRRTVAVATAVPLLALTAACSTGNSHHSSSSGKRHSSHSSGVSKEKDHRGGSGGSGRIGGSQGSTAGPTSRQLVRALLREGDVPGVRPQADKGLKPDDTLRADRAACQPVADLLGSRSPAPRLAQARTTLIQTSGRSSTVITVNLASYHRGGAQRVLSTVREALRDCTAFTATAGDGSTARYQVKQVSPQPKAGNEALAFDVLTSQRQAGRQFVPLRATLMRSSGHTATLLSFDPLRHQPAAVDQKVLDKQHEKLSRVPRR